MPRKPRILEDGAYYHIVTRGNDKRKLFRYNHDYKYFTEIVSNYLTKFQIYILNYCLMPNHIHILIKVEKSEDLPKFMQAVLQVYASYFRKKYNCVGFIFQNRYRSSLIHNDTYLLECARYIERNPLRAKLTDNLLAYQWSSFAFYAKGTSNAIVNSVNLAYLELSNEEERKQRYCDYVIKARPHDLIINKEFRLR